jgi:hypothetical protein
MFWNFIYSLLAVFQSEFIVSNFSPPDIVAREQQPAMAKTTTIEPIIAKCLGAVIKIMEYILNSLKREVLQFKTRAYLCRGLVPILGRISYPVDILDLFAELTF